MYGLMKWIALALVAITPLSAIAITNASLFAWAAANLPQYFGGTPITGQTQEFDFRYYPGTGNYLGVDSDGGVYVLGPATENVLYFAGTSASFAPYVEAWETSQVKSKLPLMRAMSIAGNWGSNVDGFKNFPEAFVQSPLISDNLNWIGIKLPIFNASIADPAVRIRYRPSSDTNYANIYSFDDADIVNAVTKLKQRGFKIYLSMVLSQPSSDQSSTCMTAQYGVDLHLLGDSQVPTAQNSSAWKYQCIDPAMWWWNPSHPSHSENVAIFWSTYTQVAVYYAKIAKQLGVDMLALGEETDRLFITQSSARFPNNYRNELSQMVSAVRRQYDGLLTYGQQSFIYWPHPEWWGLDNKASASLFKDLELDVVGISSAFPLVDSPVTNVLSVAQLEADWSAAFRNYIVPLQANNPTTPIIFSDIGFADSVNAPYAGVSQSGEAFVFSDANGNGLDDGMEQQANLVQALFNVNEKFDYLLRGVVLAWSQIDTNPGAALYDQTHRGIQLHGKLVEKVITDAYAHWKNVAP